MSGSEAEAEALPHGVPAIWYMGRADGTRTNRHRFQGAMRPDGSLWCVACKRFEHLDGRPFGPQPGNGTIDRTP